MFDSVYNNWIQDVAKRCEEDKELQDSLIWSNNSFNDLEIIPGFDAENNNTSDDTEITFGILLADARQDDVRQYLLNYLDEAFGKNDKRFTCFMPGYSRKYTEGSISISYDNEQFYFDANFFNTAREYILNSILPMESHLTFTSSLILLSVNPFFTQRDPEALIFDLNTATDNLKQCSEFFANLNDAIIKCSSLSEIKKAIGITYIKSNILKVLLESFSLDPLNVFVGCCSKIYSYLNGVFK